MNSEINSHPVESTRLQDDEPVAPRTRDHAIATGVGLVGGGAAGAAIGLTLGGPVGAIVGALVGAVAGGAGGSSAAEVAESALAPEPDKPAHYEPLLVPPTHEEIAERAWRYFAERGKTHGHDFDDWIRAERDLYLEALAARGEI